jgi:hypothetical protein
MRDKRLRWLTRGPWWQTLCVFVVALACLLLWKLHYTVRSFSGDGQITDTGFWSYPRYHITFPDIRIGEKETYTFSFRGAPPVHVSFALRLRDTAQLSVLHSLGEKLTIGMRLQDLSGNTLCDARSSLVHWVESTSSTDVEYWHEACRDIALRRSHTYVLTVTVEGGRSEKRSTLLTPVLEGGGTELP